MGGPGWRTKIRQTYASLVDDGLYTTTFRHGEGDRRFVASVLEPLVSSLGPKSRVLEVGCGAGEWLDLVATLVGSQDPPGLFGFDLTPEMIEVARRRLAHAVPEQHLRSGDLFDLDAYAFDGEPARSFELVYAFDVIQQLPPREQPRAAAAVFDQVSPGGHLVLFDQDAASRAGRNMRARKTVTRFLRIPLVPRYYLLARYPRATVLARALTERSASVRLVRPGSGARFALVAARPA